MTGKAKILGMGFNVGSKELFWLIALIFAAGVTYGGITLRLNNGLKEVDSVKQESIKSDSITNVRMNAYEMSKQGDHDLLLELKANMENLVIPTLNRIETKVDNHIENEPFRNLTKK